VAGSLVQSNGGYLPIFRAAALMIVCYSFQFPFRKRPRAEIAIAPKCPAWIEAR